MEEKDLEFIHSETESENSQNPNQEQDNNELVNPELADHERDSIEYEKMDSVDDLEKQDNYEPTEALQQAYQEAFEEPTEDAYINPEEDIEESLRPYLGAYMEQMNEPVQRKGIKWILVLLFLLLLALGIYCIIADSLKGSTSKGYVAGDVVNVSIKTEHKPDIEKKYQDENGCYTVEGIAQCITPSIVEIYTYTNSKDITPTSSGSGFILTKDGYIATNEHVISDGEKYLVHVYEDAKEDPQIYNATLVGKDSKTDIAVLKINADNLQAVALGDSDEAVLGETVVAIGSPAGLSNSISTGIVSGLNRKIRTSSTQFEMNCIQTDAAVNSGNSGGALLNMYGQVIGIISSKYISSYYSNYEGLGFAININDAKDVITEIIEKGYVGGRFRIGIVFYQLNQDYCREKFQTEMGFEVPSDVRGLWIQEISEDCDIANSGLEVYDVITAIDGTEIEDYDDIYNKLKEYEIGVKIPATVLKFKDDGTYEEITIEFCLMEDTSGDY